MKLPANDLSREKGPASLETLGFESVELQARAGHGLTEESGHQS